MSNAQTWDEITTLLQQKCHKLDLTMTHCNILLIVILLRDKLLLFKAPVYSIVCHDPSYKLPLEYDWDDFESIDKIWKLLFSKFLNSYKLFQRSVEYFYLINGFHVEGKKKSSQYSFFMFILSSTMLLIFFRTLKFNIWQFCSPLIHKDAKYLIWKS